jgi:hypothetical protein
VQSEVSSGISNLSGCSKNAYFTGLIFRVLGHFRSVSVNFDDFRPPFFLFSLFFDFQIRYTRVVNPTLYYWSSGNTFKAGQLGPRGVVFVQHVDLGFESRQP